MRERTSKSIRFQKVCVTTYLLRKMDLEMLPHLKKLFNNLIIIASFSRSSITGKSIFIAWLSTVDCKYFIVLFQTLRCILWWDRGRGSQHPHRVGFVFQDPVLRSEQEQGEVHYFDPDVWWGKTTDANKLENFENNNGPITTDDRCLGMLQRFTAMNACMRHGFSY